ncbi:hypothetical protein IWW38_003584 [Coemansia aciculifera]|uniref:Uncharacterized protein n=1 Tax=Coemansia aciculifera TaxID=417176 RepID=A0ACC1M0C9_9FUNG|nr:hypothetical protein IWW38_003584 [Coemansia aciculifera]
MKFSLSLAVTSCLLALSNATFIGIDGNTQVNHNVNDYSCHKTPAIKGSNLQVLVYQGPANSATFYSSSDCKGEGKTYYDRGGQWQHASGTVKSYRLVKPGSPPLHT